MELLDEPLTKRDGWIWSGMRRQGAVSLAFPLGAVGWLRPAQMGQVRGHASPEVLAEERGVRFARTDFDTHV
jgi:hypothetical protein